MEKAFPSRKIAAVKQSGKLLQQDHLGQGVAPDCRVIQYHLPGLLEILGAVDQLGKLFPFRSLRIVENKIPEHSPEQFYKTGVPLQD